MIFKILFLSALFCTSFASFCGDSSIPFSLEVRSDGQPVLGCARPACFGWAPSGMPLSNTASFQRINGHHDGFRRLDRLSVPPFAPFDPRFSIPQMAACEVTFGSSNCKKETQWVGGISPVQNVSEYEISLQCCTYEPLKDSSDEGTATVAPGQIYIGGEVTDDGTKDAFDYISDVTKNFDQDGVVYYDVSVRRFACPNSTSYATAPKMDGQTKVRVPADVYAVYQAMMKNNNTKNDNNHQDFDAYQIKSQSRTNVESSEVEETSMLAPHAIQQLPEIQQSHAQKPPMLLAQQELASLPAPPSPYFSPPSYPGLAQLPSPFQAPYQPAYPGSVSAADYGGYSFGTTCCTGYFCFTADTLVRLSDGSEKRMDELKVADSVQTLEESKVGYSPVIFWLHRVPSKMAQFKRIELSDGTTLKLTAKHYIYKTSCEYEGELDDADTVTTEAVFAESVDLGDCLYRVEGLSKYLTKVVAIDNIEERGYFAPMTANGKIVVNGVYASCHNIVQSYPLQNTFFSYVEDVHNILSSLFKAHDSDDERDLPIGMGTMMDMIRLVLPQSFLPF